MFLKFFFKKIALFYKKWLTHRTLCGIMFIDRNREQPKGRKETVIDMTGAEKRAVAARTQDLIKAGVDKEIARVMAKAELDCDVIRPVVRGC